MNTQPASPILCLAALAAVLFFFTLVWTNSAVSAGSAAAAPVGLIPIMRLISPRKGGVEK